MRYPKRCAAAAACAILLYFLPAAARQQEPATKQLIADVPGLPGIDRGFRADPRARTGRVERDSSREGTYVQGRVLVRWRPRREPSIRDLTRDGIPAREIDR